MCYTNSVSFIKFLTECCMIIIMIKFLDKKLLVASDILKIIIDKTVFLRLNDILIGILL